MTFGDVVAAHHAQQAPPRKRRRWPERLLQEACVEWFALAYGNRGRGLLLHIPNGGTRVLREAVALKRGGVVPGVPDLMLCLPHGRVIWFELKAGKNTLSEHQQHIGERLAGMQFQVHVIRSLSQFTAIVDETIINQPK